MQKHDSNYPNENHIRDTELSCTSNLTASASPLTRLVHETSKPNFLGVYLVFCKSLRAMSRQKTRYPTPKNTESKQCLTTNHTPPPENREMMSRKTNGITKIDLVWEKLTAVLNLSATTCRYYTRKVSVEKCMRTESMEICMRTEAHQHDFLDRKTCQQRASRDRGP